jgi:hypothetical protein
MLDGNWHLAMITFWLDGRPEHVANTLQAELIVVWNGMPEVLWQGDYVEMQQHVTQAHTAGGVPLQWTGAPTGLLHPAPGLRVVHATCTQLVQWLGQQQQQQQQQQQHSSGQWYNSLGADAVAAT